MMVGTFQYPVYVHSLKNISVRSPTLPNTAVFVQQFAFHTDTNYDMMQFEIVFRRFPE